MTIRNDDASNLAWLEREDRDREARSTNPAAEAQVSDRISQGVRCRRCLWARGPEMARTNECGCKEPPDLEEWFTERPKPAHVSEEDVNRALALYHPFTSDECDKNDEDDMRAVLATDRASREAEVDGPDLCAVSNGDDSTSRCLGCDEERDESHSFAECIDVLRRERDANLDLAVTREAEAERLLTVRARFEAALLSPEAVEAAAFAGCTPIHVDDMRERLVAAISSARAAGKEAT